MTDRARDPALAAALGLLVPGAAHLYIRDLRQAMVWFLPAPAVWLASGGLLGWAWHVLAARSAYRRARGRGGPPRISPSSPGASPDTRPGQSSGR